MRYCFLLLPLLAGCGHFHVTPEGRAYFLQGLAAQNQRNHEYAMHNSAVSAQYLNRMPRRTDYPTYYARPDPLYRGGTIISPNRFGY